ncbi:sulfatase-like hydrolase/transferase [Carboxylicivirga mesophila]|uniref:Sulfatase-like hydrolase/transferase n=1 Tax=Carboxylicivirga mesophila TaxID=1166478 RepID=A0ABS5K8S8_9BACT|nr:sulfatase [Carboxylicivirga mesophila]MBS2211267.1 sulfatase-like hydrolase/transferase [Carboxylicivirga mesophila]
MKKNLRLHWFSIVILALAAACQVKSVEPPNILWITIEDTSPHFIGCYGNKDANTPVIDQLAGEGVHFNNAFSTGTVCSPSRTAIITGVKTYKTGTGNHRSTITIPDYIKGFPYYLQQKGYYTTNNKKTDYNVSDEKAYTAEAWHESSDSAGWWNRADGQPFFAIFNFMDSHQSRTMTHTYDWYKKQVLNKLDVDERIAENEFEIPPFYNDTPAMRKQFARVYNSLKLTDNKIGALLQRLEADGLKENTIIIFYADHGEGIPRGKTNGINLGYRVPFIMWFPEKYKHLSPWGTGGVTSNELVSFEDLAPTMISLARGAVPEHLTGRVLMGENRSDETNYLVLSSDRADNGIDMVRTVTNGKYLYSRNFMPFIPEARYIRYMEISDIKQQMRRDYEQNLLNPVQKRLFEARPAEYLYNIDDDQWELNNLVNDEKHQEVLNKMRQLLKQEMLNARDVMLLPEYELERIAKEQSPYEYRMGTAFAIEDILNSAWLAGNRGDMIAGEQVVNLSDSNQIVRYWAAVGLRSQPADILLKHAEAIRKAMDDTYAPVAITAAAMAWNQWADKKAEGLLKEFCFHPDNNLALMAIHYLMYINDKTPFIETVRASRELEGRNYNAKAAAVDFLGSLGLMPNNPSYRQ